LSSADGDNRPDAIATVFHGVDNRTKSGYLLRDMINKIANIHFTSSEQLHTLGALYESVLREMRDAAGDSGKFYTPRPVVRFMVEVIDPRLGETVLDPPSGTGGFLVEAFNHLSKQVKTVGDRRRLQTESIFGCEPKSLPYLLGQMNLLLHGLDAPQIDSGNSLRFKLSEIGEKDRVDERLHAKMNVCDWTNLEIESSHLIAAIDKGEAAARPYILLSIPSSAPTQLSCAKSYVAKNYPESPKHFWQGGKYQHKRIRVAYLSADFHDHPVSYLLAGFFDQHDREQFETIAISFGPENESPIRARLKNSFDRFFEVRYKNHSEIAHLLRELEVDIAVDLMH
jgi:N-6 DNA Methylase/Glycosyl transferase family 41